MKERPILMQGWGVRATLDGRKSQTRRVLKRQPVGEWAVPGKQTGPYGCIGDLLYFRETWCNAESCGFDARADGGEYWYRATDEGRCMGPWKPSIFMPKAAARIWRRIADIRAERVQDISPADCKAEGIVKQLDWVSSNLLKAYQELWDSINAKPKLSKRNPWTRAPEDCYVSYPWDDIQETRLHRGLTWYVIGNPRVWALSYENVNR